MPLPAFIYARFSSQEQSKGHSLKRQFQEARKLIHTMRWEYPDLDLAAEPKDIDWDIGCPERDLSDQGKSAFSGANRQSGGSLHELERKAKLGHFRNGIALVVENIDRFTRQGWQEALDILSTLTSNGVTVAIVQKGRIFHAGQRIEMQDAMMVVLESELSREESAKKSERLLRNWQFRVDAIVAGDKKALSKVPPRWIDVDPKTYAMSLNPRRAAVLKEIYELYVEGWGLPRIVAMLNGRGEASWAYGKKNTGAGWNTAYLHKLLTNRAVMGEFEPMSRTHGGINETSKGIRVPDYYPQAITPELFQRAQAHRGTRQRIGGSNSNKLNNLFSGILTCQHCHAPMYFSSQQIKGRPTRHLSKVDGRPLNYIAQTNRSVMICNNRRRSNQVNIGHGVMGQCPNSGKPRYEFLERAVLDTVLSLAMDNVSFATPDRVAALEVQLAEHERLIDGKRFKLNNLHQAMAEAFSAGVARMAADLEAEISADTERAREMVRELEREKGQASPEEHFERVREVRSALHSEDEETRYKARVRVQTALRNVIRMSSDKDAVTSVWLANSLMGWRFSREGDLIDSFDLRQRLDLRHGLQSGELTNNAGNIEAVLRRSA